MNDLQRIKPKDDRSITECITDAIINAIAEKRWPPGSKIPTEIELSAMLGVSRNSVREAVKILTALGILEIMRPNGTYVVKTFNDKMLNSVSYSFILEDGSSTDLYEFRKMFEESIMRLAIVNASEDDAKAIQRACDDLVGYILSPEKAAEKLLEKDLALHNAIVNATHNTLVIRINQIINKVSHGSRIKALESALQDNGLDEMLASHKEITRVVVEKEHAKVYEALTLGYGDWPKMLQ